MGAAMTPTEFTAAAKGCLQFTLPSMVGSFLGCVIFGSTHCQAVQTGCVCCELCRMAVLALVCLFISQVTRKL